MSEPKDKLTSEPKDKFTSGKFIPRDSDEPVVGWVTVSADIKRDPALKPQRAMVITERDVETLKLIKSIVNQAEFLSDHDDDKIVALLDRLIGPRQIPFPSPAHGFPSRSSCGSGCQYRSREPSLL